MMTGPTQIITVILDSCLRIAIESPKAFMLCLSLSMMPNVKLLQ